MYLIIGQQQQPSEIPLVESGEGSMYADLTPTRRGREAVSERPSAQEDKKTKGDNISNTTEII